MSSHRKQTRARSIAAGLMAAVSVVALQAAPAYAQATGGARLDVVIVSAQQREENLQEVPISAASIPEDTLAAIFSSGEDVLALAARVPGVYAESSNGRVAPRFYIRGLGNTDFDLAASQPVSIIMDDVVMENVVLKSTPLFDLGRVEVYRGPQGTLFGRNTTAGIIRFTSRKPSHELDASASTSWGSYNTFTLDAGVGGPVITDTLALRASMLYQHRDDWIDNTRIAGEYELGGFDELAGRLQALWTPTADIDVLFNIHGRDLDGTSAVFRANILGPGNNSLNGNYRRDSVNFNQGAGNPQAYQEWGASAKVDWDLGAMTLTSITSLENADGFSRGDIDGGTAQGAGVFNPGPGFIPFNSDTQDSLEDLEQITQEFRLAGDTGGPLVWQAGAYFFQSGFEVNTQGPFGFPPLTSLEHENNAWAVFGQASYELTGDFILTGGLRYTDDEKTLSVAANPTLNRDIEDSHLSWEVSGMWDVTDAFSLFGRVAEGFRGPSIQGRDIAFGAPPSLAQSETVQSYEIGWKSTLFSDTLRLNGAVFTYEVDDIQLTAVGGAGNTVQLINAEKGEAVGAEIDAEWAPSDNLVFTGGIGFADTELDDSGLSVGICAQCTVTDATVVLGGATRALVDGNPFPNAPEFTADFTARYSMPWGTGGEIFAFTDWSFQGDTNLFLYESLEFNTQDQFEGGLRLGYVRTDGSWEAAIFARNITDEDNVKGGIDFNNNTGFLNEPRIIGASLRVNY